MRSEPGTDQLGLFADQPRLTRASPVTPAPHGPAIDTLAGELPPLLRMGTSSWSFTGWRGLIYAGKPDQSRLANFGLGAYSAFPLFRTVGLDRTFYRPITREQFSDFAAQVPDDFRFLVKAHQVITRPHELDRSGSVIGPNPAFLDAAYTAERVIAPAAEGLGEKCGPILFQFSPMRLDTPNVATRLVDQIGLFLHGLPRGLLYAVELRNPELLTPAYAAGLNDAGASHCFNIHPTMPPLDEQADVVGQRSGPATICRWMLSGRYGYEEAGERYAPFDRLVDEDPATRVMVAELAVRAIGSNRPVYIIADNKAEGSAPRTIEKLGEAVLRRLRDRR
jgi:uncharacterized protein YecE (DUF72 family)